MSSLEISAPCPILLGPLRFFGSSMAHLRDNPLVFSRLLVSGMCAIGLLWIFALWNSLAQSAQHIDTRPYSSSVVTDHVAIHIANEQQLIPRFHRTGVLTGPQIDEIQFAIGPFLAALAILVTCQTLLASARETPFFSHQLQLQTLNISRAPPLSF